jgi:potassium-dependent mechanosensitive channel
MINISFVIQLVLVFILLGLLYGGDSILGRLLRRSRDGFLQRNWVRLGLRLGLWLGVLAIIGTQVPVLKPLVSFVASGFVSVSIQIHQGLNVPIADLGKTRLSLSTILTVIFATIAIFMGARLLSQAVKTWLLKQSRIERGLQEAIATCITYAIAILGFVIVLQTIGLDLSSLAVLAGVLGLGFGLGLQELASNFVSGLTLLFEQQLRVGDFVEIDGLFGTIERISIRSTILRTTDQRFIIVPNHQVFQKNVTNWSFQTPDTRIHIPVHVAFGSDAVLVTETLLNAAQLEPRVLRHPPPVVWFKAFCESSYSNSKFKKS